MHSVKANGCALALIAIAACGGSGPSPAAASLTSGSATLALSADGKTLTLTRGATTLLTFGTASFQVGTVDDLDSGESFDPYWLFVDDPPAQPEGLAWHALASDDFMKVTSSTDTELQLELDTDGATAQLTFDAEAPNAISLAFTATSSADQPIAYFRVRQDADPSEGFYGLGEWADSVDHRGKLRPIQMEYDATLENSDDENHVPVPLLLGTTGWGMFVESKRPGSFDVARQSDTLVDVTFGTGSDSGDGLLVHYYAEAKPLDLLAHYFARTGVPGLPAPWALGPLLWRDENTNQAQVLDDIDKIRNTYQLPTSGVWFDRPYATGVETFDWNPAKFADPGTMLQALHDAGLRYGVWQAPYTADGSNADPAPANLAYATAHGYFPPTTAILLNNWGKPIDFTNPDAFAWWQTNLKQYTDPLGSGGWGVEGFKLDYGEDVVLGLDGARVPWQFADGTDEGTEHYTYTRLYHQVHRTLLAQQGAWMLDRTGRWGDQTIGAIIWPGDLDASMAQQGDPLAGSSLLAVGGVPAALTKGIGLSASGFPFYASDTGGYKHSPANNETWTRWAEANAVQTAMEVGDASSEMPWEFDDVNGRNMHTIDVYRTYASLHMRLFPYEWTYAQSMATTGYPILRPVGLAYPELGVHPTDEYLFGDSLLSAPVVVAGATSRQVILPPGTWIGWWDGKPYTGTIDFPADLDTLPLFLAAGGIVPMLRDTIQTMSPVVASSTVDSFATDPGVLWVRVAPADAPSTFTVYDGTLISQDLSGATLSLEFTPPVGGTFTEGALFEVIGVAAPSSVSASSSSLTPAASLDALKASATGYFYDASATGGTLWVKVPGPSIVTVAS